MLPEMEILDLFQIYILGKIYVINTAQNSHQQASILKKLLTFKFGQFIPFFLMCKLK